MIVLLKKDGREILINEHETACFVSIYNEKEEGDERHSCTKTLKMKMDVTSQECLSFLLILWSLRTYLDAADWDGCPSRQSHFQYNSNVEILFLSMKGAFAAYRISRLMVKRNCQNLAQWYEKWPKLGEIRKWVTTMVQTEVLEHCQLNSYEK